MGLSSYLPSFGKVPAKPNFHIHAIDTPYIYDPHLNDALYVIYSVMDARAENPFFAGPAWLKFVVVVVAVLL